MSSERRLIRIEGKLDKLEFALTKIARTEEKIANIIERQTRLEEEYRSMREDHKGLRDTLSTHTIQINSHEDVIGGLRKIFWAIVTAIVLSGIGGTILTYNLLQQAAIIVP